MRDADMTRCIHSRYCNITEHFIVFESGNNRALAQRLLKCHPRLMVTFSTSNKKCDYVKK